MFEEFSSYLYMKHALVCQHKGQFANNHPTNSETKIHKTLILSCCV